MPTIVQPAISAPGRNRSVAMARFWAHLKRHNPAMRIKSRQNPALSGHEVWRDSREDANRLGKSKDRPHAQSGLTQRRNDGVVWNGVARGGGNAGRRGLAGSGGYWSCVKSSLAQRRNVGGHRSAHTFAKRKGAGNSGACPLPFRTCMKMPDKGEKPTSGLQLQINPA